MEERLEDDRRFDASQYAFFGGDVSQEIELGGLDEEDDVALGGVLEEEEEGLLGLTEKDEVEAVDNVSNLDDVSVDISESDPNFSAAPMDSGEGQSNPSTSGDAGGDHNEDYGNEYGPPLPTQEELRKMEHRRLVGEATNMMLNFAKDPKLAKYMTETAFQDVHAHWKATTTSPPKPDTKKQYSEKDLEEEVEARLARIPGAQNQGEKHDKKRKKSTDFPGCLGSQSTFDKAKKHKKRAEVPSSSSSSSGSSSDSSEEDRKGKKRNKKQRHKKGKKKAGNSKSRRVDDSSTEDTSTDSSDSEDGHFYANKKNFYKANQYDFLEDEQESP
ncbi:hypothetical protein L7F22_042501 [Adiantum nelumboides]|nr:hypothetical protein [Adiantum nelumboides]